VIDFLGETAFTGEQMFSVGSFSGRVEFTREFPPRPQVSHVIFDFDGTLSWLRHGWPQIMAGLFREHLAPNQGETEAEFEAMLLSDILSLNGKPALFQMRRCAELAAERGSQSPDPDRLLAEYQRRLDMAIAGRIEQLQDGEARPDAFVIHGARPLLENLARRGLTLIILSGTVEDRVKAEAALLDLTRYFGEHIYGGTSDLARSSKSAVIERLIGEERIAGDRLLSFGDGPVEIQLTKAVGGLAVAVASDEEINGSGKADQPKRKQLLAAGADLIIPDYRDAEPLLERLLGS
jgi:phosphoglycolate phosphatase-like HAD superfamily hydrolase